MSRRYEYIVRPAYNKEALGKTEKTNSAFNELGDDGWLYQGEITRHWHKDGGEIDEHLEVFSRELGEAVVPNLKLVEGQVYCDLHGSVHDATGNPFDEIDVPDCSEHWNTLYTIDE